MEHLDGPLLLLIAGSLAAIIGFVNHRGGTCTVAAVCELFEGKPGRLVALAEAGLWAFALGMVLKLAGLSLPASDGAPITGRVIAGGLLLGLGAWFNKACLFGTLAQLGRRNANYLFTLVGLFAGFLAHAAVMANAAIATVPYHTDRAVVLGAGLLFATSLLSAVWSAAHRGSAKGRQGVTLGHREAVLIHAVAFTLMASIAGAWTYGDLLSKYAQGSGQPDAIHLLLCCALLLGALLGGWRTERSESLTLPKATACFVGGALLAAGSTLVPGGNDRLILYGAPLLQWHAITAIAVMIATLAVCVVGQNLVNALRRNSPSAPV